MSLQNYWQKKLTETLFLATQKGKFKIIKLIIYIDRENLLNVRNILQCSLLQIAMKYDHFEIGEFLIKQKIEKHQINLKKQNILYLACEKFQRYHIFEIMKKLLCTYSWIDILAKDMYGNLPIHYISPNSERLHWFPFFEYTYIGINTKNNQGSTLIWYMNKRDKNVCLTSYI